MTRNLPGEDSGDSTDAVQDYVKAIYHLGGDTGPVTTTAIAGRVGVAPPSVTAMVRRLDGAGLVRHVPYRGVALTAEGRQLALRMVRRHRVIEAFLHDVLHLSWDEVHREAEVLEHAVSERVEDAMAGVLGEPARDPHGDPIPPRRGTHQEHPDEPLLAAPAGSRVRVERVSDRDPTLLRRLGRLGIRPGTVLAVEGAAGPDGGLRVRLDGRRRHVAPDAAGAVEVSRLTGQP